jgi:hypothetical protein
MEADAEMKEQFANPAEGWFSIADEAHQPQKVGMNWNKGEYFGPVDVTVPLTNAIAAEGKLTVTIEGDQTAPGAGYDLAVSTSANSPKLSLELFRNGNLIERAEAQVADASGACQIRVGRRGTYIVVHVDDHLVIAARQTDGAAGPSREPEERTPQVQDDTHTATEATAP